MVVAIAVPAAAAAVATIVQSYYDRTRNKLKEKVSQMFSIQKKVLYHLLKVLRNPIRG